MEQKNGKIAGVVEQQLLRILKQSFGDDLLAVLVYGSYVAGNFRPGVSDVNILVIVGKTTADALTAFGRAAHRLMRRYNVAPLILSRDEFINSADVFPMEYLDIASRHKVIHGEDITKELNLDSRNLRHQLEHQMRGTLVTLRQIVTEARGRKWLLKRRLRGWYGSVAVLFRNMLRLRGVEEIPNDAVAMVNAVNASFQLEKGPFLDLLALRSGEQIEVLELARSLVDRMGEIISIVDKELDQS